MVVFTRGIVENMRRKEKIRKVVKATRMVFRDCLLMNGCLVAAPAQVSYYPKNAKSYMYSWPGRDLGFSLVAMLLLGEDHFEPALTWIWDRSEDFQKSNIDWMEGLLFRSYHVNGKMREHNFQPDQTGTLLWAIGERMKASSSEKQRELFECVARKAAWGLHKIWDGDHFNPEIEDLWEERIPPGHKTNLTYSLAACCVGMRWAGEHFGDDEWKKIADQMRSQILESACSEEHPYILRQCGGDSPLDTTVDASLAGLVWPFDCGIERALLAQTTDAIVKNLVSSHGVHRYPDDKYKGAPEGDHEHINDQAGAWPLLTYWLAIAYRRLGKKKEAEKHFWLATDLVEDDGLISEQFFCCERVPWVGVKPLLWSHAMFVFAARELGFL